MSYSQTDPTTRIGGRRATEIILSEEARNHLEAVASAGSSTQREAERAKMILLAAAGKINVDIGLALDKHPDTVGRWRARYARHGPKGLHDAPRSGRPSKFSAESKAKILQAATEAPLKHGQPITHWSSSGLARLAKDAGIERPIHPTTIWRWLDQADIRPHRRRMWMRKVDPDFEVRMADVTSTYLSARAWAALGIPVFCVDEKTGIQALERKFPDLPVRPGTPQYSDPHYKRHGTMCLSAAFEVATGQVSGLLTKNRPATVFAEFARSLCEGVPDAPKIHFVCDQLNTHWHHEICKVVAGFSGLEYDPKEHKTGSERRAFLLQADKRVVFHFTPKHASWLNQIEIWFSTLGRKALNRGSFASLEDLCSAINDFIEYHNQFLARPYKWTYTGTPCQA